MTLKERKALQTAQSDDHYKKLLESKLTPEQKEKLDEYNAKPLNREAHKWKHRRQGKLNWDLH